MRLIFNMNNTMFKLPFNPNNLEEPLLSMYFDLTFTMDAKNVYDDIITHPSNKVLAQIYETKTSYMHVSLSQCEFDIVYFVLQSNFGSYNANKAFYNIYPKPLTNHVQLTDLWQ